MNRTWLALIFLAVSTVGSQAANLKTCKAVHNQNLEAILRDQGAKLAKLEQQYPNWLAALKAQVQADGDLKKTMAVMAEIERFQRDKNVGSDAELPEIKRLQAAYAKQMADLETDKARRITALVTRYNAELSELQKELTRAGKLDEAIAVQEERNQIKNGDHIVAAANRVKESAASVSKKTNTPVELLPGKAMDSNLGNATKMKLILIQPGKFLMGCQVNEQGRNPQESPQHEVTISKPFYMGVHAVRQDEYESVMRSNPSRNKGPNLPVDSVTWDDAMSFCKQLATKTGKNVRLPTEAEWEYACRADSKTAYSFGDDSRDLGAYGWFKDNSDALPGDKNAFANKMTHPVGGKKPNAWGLYDMHGNICQWCQDCFGKYTEEAAVDPQGPAEGKTRVMRGGSCNLSAGDCRSAFRIAYPPGRASGHVGGFGFRVVVEAPKAP